MNTTSHRRAVAALVGAVALAAVALGGCSSDDSTGTTVTVTHGAVPAPTVIDNGTPGASPGDVRIFHFDAEQEGGGAVTTDWVMTTTAIDAPEAGLESRIANAAFTFGDQPDQLLLEGVAYYPGEGSTLAVSSTTIRSIIGGSGRYEGATGWVESVHLDDGSWTHTFHID